MASMRDIKRRKGSVQSTQQITKAMKLVSTVKLQKAKQKAEQTTNYFDAMYNTVQNMLAKAKNINHPYLQASDSPKKLVIMITSNKGLAGGYNSNIIKLITQGEFKKEDKVVYKEGLFFGYRYYEKEGIQPAFAFGHGLSYTDFAFGKVQVEVLKDASASIYGARGACGVILITTKQ